MVFNYPEIIISSLILIAAFVAIASKKIDVKGALVGIMMAYIIWKGTGEVALMALFVFFVMGTLASSWKKDQKLKLKLAQENDGKRGIRNVLSNGGIATILSFCAFLLPEYHDILFSMTITSFAVACSDTLSSELGNIYGRKYFNIISLKSAPRGMDGAVSIQGFLVGIVGSAAMAALPMLFHIDWKLFVIITLSGFLGNIMDSILGATLQQKGKLSNHDVNFWATASGALFSLAATLSF
jgi:uncharacterized protein (TIGR00297 family)